MGAHPPAGANRPPYQAGPPTGPDEDPARRRSGPALQPARSQTIRRPQKVPRSVAASADRWQLTERHWDLLVLLASYSHRDPADRMVSWWPQADKNGKPGLATTLGVKARQLRNLLADLRQPGSDPRHPTKQPPGRRLGWVKVEPQPYTDKATGRHRLGGNLYVVTELGQQALAEHDQQAMAEHTVPAGHVNRQWLSIAGLNKRNPASEEKKVSSPTPTAFSNPRPVAASDRPPSPCGWDACKACQAVLAFEAKWETGESKPAPAVTSAWWESAEADAFYARGVNLPACHHPEDLPVWPVTPSLALRASA